MATLSHAKSRRMYSWWWDSHISPKNSKWLQENLTDMDSKLKAMIKLIEEDADSFARRAEMYYKKRPELMKLVEEFYRAYRALAERYDHATVVIRQAHQTMEEAFPNQDPSVHGDDSPANSGSGDNPRAREMSTPPRQLLQTDDAQRNNSELSTSNGENKEVSDLVSKRHGLKQRNSESGDYPKLSRVRKGLTFDQVGETEEILILKKALAEVEAEKEAGLVQYQQSLDKLSKLESKISHAEDDSRELSERASIAESEVEKLKEALSKVEAQKDANLREYLEKLSSLEKIISQAEVDTAELNGRATKAESEANSLRDKLEKVTSDKDSALDQYVLSLEKISNLENKLEFAEEDARKLRERAEKAENEIETLKQEILKFSEEKEAAAVQYQQCMETISHLESRLSSAHEEVQQLRMEIDDGVSKLKGAGEQCLLLERSNQTLHSELQSLTLKMGAQGQELTEKQKEVGRLWTCIQEERLRFVEAETAFQTLQRLHAQTQEEIRSLALELQNGVQVLKGVEARYQTLEDEVLKVKEENTSLSEVNVSSAISMKNMREEICNLLETKGKLEEEVELRVDQRNALQQEIYSLKEELNDVNKNHFSILEQVNAVGLTPECLKSSVKELQDEISNLKQMYGRERSEKEALLKKLEILGQLLEKNSTLENSLKDLSVELAAARGTIKALEESCQSLLQEKSNLLDEKANLGNELHATNENLEKLSENNTVLENSLSDAHVELQTLKGRLKSLEDSHQLLADQKASLARDFENELDRALHSEIEIFILRKCALDLKETNLSVLIKYQKLLEASTISENLISQLHKENVEQQKEVKLLSHQASTLRKGTLQLLKALDLVSGDACEDNNEQDLLYLTSMLQKIEDTRRSLGETEEENQKLALEKMVLITLLQQLRFHAEQLEMEKLSIEQELKISTEHSFILQNEALRFRELNEELKLKLWDKDHTEEALGSKVEDLQRNLSDVEGSFQGLQRENLKILEEKRSLTEALLKQMNENDMWETQAAVIFSQLQTSTIFRVLYEQKIHELIEACNSLKQENTVKDTDIKLLSERVSTYASENEGLNSRLAAYGPAITSLRECISSLESKTVHRKLQKPTTQELQGDEMTDFPKNHFVEDEDVKVTDSYLELQDLQNRVRMIEKTVVTMEQLVVQENSNVHSQLKAALKHIEELKSENSLHRRSLKPKSEISEAENSLMTKDIMLDHVSESSSYGISRRKQVEADNQICELWETADKDDSIDLTVGKVKKIATPSPEKNFDLRKLKSLKKKRREFPSSDGLLVKELSVDKLEISKISTSSSQEGNNRKILQRLNSDVQKLTNLHITVRDLKRKLEITERSRNSKAIDDSDTLKVQLEEAEATILKLLNLNGKLTRSVEDSSFSSDIKSAMEYEDSECIRRRRVSEQARRVSEKIGRLQLEVQKIQFVLLKLDDEKESKGKTRISETKRRVLLKDYLYGGSRINQSRRKKVTFCACVQPPTHGD